ncbi:MAG: hypothetical protein AAGI68_09495, partial [Planctomycetota bacterium]
WPLPDHRHLWVLAAGLVLGVLAGPMVLGKVNAGWYERVFVSGGEGAGAATLLAVASGELAAFEAETADKIERVNDVFGDPEDSSAKAEIEGLQLRRSGERAALAERVQEAQVRLMAAQGVHLDRVRGVLLALVLAGVGVMILEGAVSPAPGSSPGSALDHGGERVEVGPGVGRLVTVRYAIGALGLGLVVAQPALFSGVSWVLVGGVLVVGLAAGLVPLGKKGSGGGA